MTLSIGIDLGTTNSSAAVMDGNGQVVMILTPERQRYMPSAVYFPPNPDDRPLVGWPALTAGRKDEAGFFRYWKLIQGLRYNPDEDTDSITGKRTVADEHGMTALVGRHGNILTPAYLWSLIVEQWVDAAEARLGERPDRAVITHPASWGELERHPLLQTADMAGLDDVRLTSEPVAACIAYAVGRKGKIRPCVVYDLGGGTFDTSAIRIGRGSGDVMARGGNQFLGGRNFDDRLVDYILDAYRAEHGVDLRHDAGAMLRIRMAAEEAKIALSSQLTVTVHEQNIETYPELRDLKVTVTRADFEVMTEDLIATTINDMRNVMTAAKLQPTDSVEVILVGGQTAMPAVQSAVANFFGRPHVGQEIDPVEVVAIGAAHEAALWDGRNVGTAFTLVDCTAHAYGVATPGDLFTTIIPAGTKFPVDTEFEFRAAEEGQGGISMALLQGPAIRASNAQRLAFFQFPTPVAPSTEKPMAKMTARIDKSGLMTVLVQGQVVWSYREIFGADDASEPEFEAEYLDDAPADAEHDVIDAPDAVPAAMFETIEQEQPPEADDPPAEADIEPAQDDAPVEWDGVHEAVMSEPVDDDAAEPEAIDDEEREREIA